MGVFYKAISWNRQKKIYDVWLSILITLYLLLYIILNLLFHEGITTETLIIRSTGTLAIILLHIVLMIGPIARLYPTTLPFLYNRRHLGVTIFFIAAVHGVFSIIQFHSLGNLPILLSVFLSNTAYDSLLRFPFETLGFLALVILFLMALTSHDFWLNLLTPTIWKALHMGVYVAYAFIIMHVILGILQYETSPILVFILAVGFMLIAGLHITAGYASIKKDESLAYNVVKGFINIGNAVDFVDTKAKIVTIGNEQIAVFRYGNKFSAVSNVCKHQMGPLGEGKIIDGCITCPWHGYQYYPENGRSPLPFKEKIVTYATKIINGEVWVDPRPYPEGTTQSPAPLNPTGNG